MLTIWTCSYYTHNKCCANNMNMFILHSQQMLCLQYQHVHTILTTKLCIQYEHVHTTLTTNVGVLTIWTCSYYTQNKCWYANNMNMVILHSQQMLCQQYEHGHTTFTTNVGVLTIWTWSYYTHNKCCANNMNMFTLHSQQMWVC